MLLLAFSLWSIVYKCVSCVCHVCVVQLTIVLCVVEYGTGTEEHVLRLAGLISVEWSPCKNNTIADLSHHIVALPNKFKVS